MSIIVVHSLAFLKVIHNVLCTIFLQLTVMKNWKHVVHKHYIKIILNLESFSLEEYSSYKLIRLSSWKSASSWSTPWSVVLNTGSQDKAIIRNLQPYLCNQLQLVTRSSAVPHHLFLNQENIYIRNKLITRV